MDFPLPQRKLSTMPRATAALRPAAVDPTVYPTEDKMGEESLQRFIVELLRPLVERWLAEKKVLAFTGADQFVYWRQHDATRRVAPHVFVLPGVRPGRRIKSWKVWEHGITPSFALEVVSADVDKDYVDAPAAYGDLGVDELVLFDPDHETAPGRVAFQVFRRTKKHGLVRIESTSADRVKSRALGCWLRAVGVGDALRLRLATGPRGDDLVPTAEEYERGEKERERGEKERERGEKEREREARLAAEAEIARLRALLEKKRER